MKPGYLNVATWVACDFMNVATVTLRSFHVVISCLPTAWSRDYEISREEACPELSYVLKLDVTNVIFLCRTVQRMTSALTEHTLYTDRRYCFSGLLKYQTVAIFILPRQSFNNSLHFPPSAILSREVEMYFYSRVHDLWTRDYEFTGAFWNASTTRIYGQHEFTS